MKRLFKGLLCLCMLLCLFGCGESKPKCEHAHTTTSYEISGLSIRKNVTCDDCEEQLEKTTIDKLQYVYNKVLVDEKGIKCTLLDVTLDGWGTLTMNLEIEGTSDKKRTFEVEKMYIDGYDVSVWVYSSDLAGNKKSLESEWLTTITGEDFIKDQSYEVEINYTILDSDSYKKLSEQSIKFNLDDYSSIEEAKS